MEASIPQRPARQGRGHRLRGAVLRHRRGRLHHRADDRRRRRPGAARVADGARGACSWSARRSRSGRRRSPRATACSPSCRRAGRAAGRRAGARGAPRRLALDDPRGARRPRAQRRRAAHARARRRHLRRRAQGRARPHEPRRAARLPAPPGLPVRRARALDRDGRGRRRDRRRARPGRGRARARGRPRPAGRRRPDLARARALPGRAVPRPARPLAGRLALRAARGALRPRAGRGGGAHRGRGRGRRRGAAARRCARGAPLLAIARTAWDADGRAFERSHDLFRADRARIVVRARSAPAAPTLVGATVQSFTTALDRFVRSWFNSH